MVEFIGPFGWCFWFLSGTGPVDPGFGPSVFTASFQVAGADWAGTEIDLT